MTNEHSTAKQIIVGGSVWSLPAVPDAVEVFKEIESALENGTVVRVAVLDAHERRVDLLINGGVVDTVVLDPCLDPRPSETSG